MSYHKARKRFGQNFLNNEQIIHQILQTIAVTGSDIVVEIGPGQGALTEYLIPQAKQLYAIELDRDLIPILISKFSEQSDKFNLINEDVLKFDFNSLIVNDELSNQYRIVGNLPYNISTPLLIYLIKFRHIIKDMYFMLQNEVVDRLVAHSNTKNFGRLSLLMQYFFHIEKHFIVPPTAFDPMPKVDSAIVSLRPYIDLEKTHGISVNNIEIFQHICKSAFQQRRKTIKNNLKGIISSEQFNKVGINESQRAENLSLTDFIRLANLISQQR